MTAVITSSAWSGTTGQRRAFRIHGQESITRHGDHLRLAINLDGCKRLWTVERKSDLILISRFEEYIASGTEYCKASVSDFVQRGGFVPKDESDKEVMFYLSCMEDYYLALLIRIYGEDKLREDFKIGERLNEFWKGIDDLKKMHFPGKV